jgi:RNA-directed DNA polymerase
MEEICERENLMKALARVESNKGSPGIDGMTVDQLSSYLKENWLGIREQLLNGTYQSQPVKRVEIPKPDGGIRNLGIPTALDRFIQQAVMQVLQRQWDETFSEHSYGFRPGRSAHQAIAEAQRYIAEGYSIVVDIDLEKFFDRVNHDTLMSRVARRIKDKRVLKLIRAFLNAGVMENGLVSPTDEGTPQGGPLSPLLSNLLLDELDKELEKRGHRFVRYADDSNIYVRSERAGQRVMKSISDFLTKKLKLRVNQEKSAVGKPSERKFLGFRFSAGKELKRTIAANSLKRFKKRIREITGRNRGVSLEQVIEELKRYLRGWQSYFGFCQTPSIMRDLNSWIRRRLRCFIWKKWRRWKTRYSELMKRGVDESLAAITASSGRGPWHQSHCKALLIAFPNAYFKSLGLAELKAQKIV